MIREPVAAVAERDATKQRVIDLHRALAAGIDRLDPDRLDGFHDEFSRAWQS